MGPSKKRRKLSNDTPSATIPPDTKTNTSTEQPPPATSATATDNSQSKQPKSSSLFVRSLPSSITSNLLASHFSQSYPLKHATVVLDPTTKISRGFGFVTFTDAADAATAAKEFDGTELGGRKIRVEVAEARHRDAQPGGGEGVPAASAATSEGVKASKKTNTTGERLRAEREQQRKDAQPPRLIVRNLPWSIRTAEDLGKLFQSYGKVKHAVVPKKDGKEGYGFGIVILRGRKNAERALQGVNGKEVDGRVVAVDWMAEREEWEKVKEVEAEVQAEANDTFDATAQADGGEADGIEEHMDIDAGEANDSDGGASLHSDENDAALNALDDGLEDIEPDAEKPSTDNTTIFIRNLPYTTDDLILREHFTEHFGPTRYARVVFDANTERSRGTGFVCFVHEDDARECVKSAPKKPASDPTSSILNRNRHGAQSSILQNDAEDPSGKYTIDGRILQVSRALPKATADQRASEGALSREKARERDKRRLYLLSEGTVPRGSTLYSMLSKVELDLREASAKQRQKLIKINPNLGLSLTRLSVRNLPRWVTSKDLKQLAREAVVGFASDAKAGKRTALSPEENRRGGEEMREAEKQRKKKGVGIVRQAKVVFEDRSQGGKVREGMGGRSRGYGFVEYWAHRSALAGLRWLNGHIVKGTEEGQERGKRLIVEFAIENAQVVQRRGEREKRVREQGHGEWEGIEDVEEVKSAAGQRGNNLKRKRSTTSEGTSNADTGKAQKAQPEPVDDDEKNKIAKRNRIISKKRFARKSRKG